MDDEVLGCGGALSRHSAHHDEIVLWVLTEPAVGRQTREQCTQVQQLLGIRELVLGSYTDQTLDRLPQSELIDSARAVLRSVRPAVVYVPWIDDPNMDHQAVAKALRVAARPGEEYLQSVLEYELPGSFKMVPDLYVSIRDTLARKHQAFQVYHTEVQHSPKPRSPWAIQVHAHARGIEVGVESAEAFKTVYRRV
jgi:LmbE family N-acetylglucosaminyl deacetylase